MKTIRKCFFLLLLLAIVVGTLAGCNSEPNKNFQGMEDFEQAKIGVLTGSSFDLLAKEYFPDAEKLFYINITDLILNLKQEKIDGVLMDKGFFTPLMWDDNGLSFVEMDMPATEYAVAFPKTAESEPLKAQINEFIHIQTENGELAKLKEKWFSMSEPDGSLDLTQLTGENGILRVATTVESKPFDYLKNGQFSGFDADFIFRFAKEYGYALEIDTMDFGALLPSLSAGRYDLAISSITVTEERKESVLFSDVYCNAPIVMAVLDDSISEESGEKTLADFAQAKMGVITGSSHDGTAKQYFPDAQRVYFNSVADMIIAVEQEKIDCYIEDAPFATALIWEGVNLKCLDETISTVENGFVFPQGESTRLREEINSFLSEAKTDGTIEQLKEKWLGAAEPQEHPDYMSLEGRNGTIRLAIAIDGKPLLYQREDYLTGLEMELLTIFGQQYGYAFDIEVIPFESIIAGIATGKYDMGAATLNITPEREESVDFSVPYASFDVVMVTKDNDKQALGTLNDLKNATFGIITGTSWDLVAQKDFPNAERKYFTSAADALLALTQSKVDAFLADKTVYVGMRWGNSSINYIDESIGQVSNALIFAKEGYDENLLAQVNEFIAKAKENGTLERLSAKWFADTEPEEHPDYTRLSGANGTLRIAVCDGQIPVSYQRGTMYTGYEIDFLTLFAEEYGYQLELKGMSFDALIPSVSSGKCDMGACGITITPERAENVTFSDPHLETHGVAIIRNESGDQTHTGRSLEELKNGKLAILTGTIWDGVAQKEFPNADRKYFSSMTDMTLSLEQGKVDAILGDKTFYVNARWENVPVYILDDTIGAISCGFMLGKDTYDPVLYEQLNSFIAQSEQDGTLDALYKKWLSDAEPSDHPDYRSLSGENGTLKIAVDNTAKPMTYQKGDMFTGYDVELLTKFASAYGYSLDFMGMSFSALIPAVASEKCDIGACGIAITPERAESVTFTTSYETIEGVAIVSQAAVSTPQNDLWEKITESFEKTFIRENRWKMIVQGIGVTMLISICAAVAGSLLGFGLYMLSRADAKALQLLAKGIAKVYSRIIAGTPVVVILMILFYVIFGKIRDMSGIVVAIIGFTLTFGAFVFDHMTVSADSVDHGQTEAAYALGYTKNKTFFRIIFPQAMTIFLPSYCGQAVELIKATAVVGYIAVNDLTKMGDIIRSNTYEAFFPLIATAVIYFLLTWILASLLKLVKLRFEPKRRSKEDILKGVKTV